MLIVGLAGKAGCGKDTVADYLQESFYFYKISLAAKIKDFGEELFNLGYEELYGDLKEVSSPKLNNYSSREFLQGLGAFLRKYDDEVWVRYLINKTIPVLLSPKVGAENIVVSDVRYRNEVSLFRKTYGSNFILIKVGADRKTTLSGEEARHESEVGLDNMSNSFFDYHIHNRSTLFDLYDEVDIFIRSKKLKVKK